jgi:hypothetical protein
MCVSGACHRLWRELGTYSVSCVPVSLSFLQ